MVYCVPSVIYLYDGGKTANLKIEEIAGYLSGIFHGIKVVVRPSFVEHILSIAENKENLLKELAEVFAYSKILKPNLRELRQNPLPGEINYEKNRLSDSSSKTFGILYDGFKIAQAFSKRINESEATLKNYHIIFTHQLFGSWDKNDRRWHARVSIYGFPSIISTTGIVVAPAKPKEYYFKKQIGVGDSELRKEFSEKYIEFDDERITEVLKGYALQALFYHITGDPFCDDINCRLYNAHWHSMRFFMLN